LTGASLLSRKEITIIGTPADVQKFFSRLFVDRTSFAVSIVGDGSIVGTEISPVAGPEFVDGLRFDRAPEAPSHAFFTWLREVYLFPLDGNLAAGVDRPLPSRVYQIHRRSADRIEFGSPRSPAAIVAPSGGAPVAAELTDLTDRGIGLICPSGVKLPLLEEVEVRFSGGPEIALKAEIAHLTPDPAGSGVRLGARITRAADPERFRAWFTGKVHPLAPSVRAAREEADFGRVADLVAAMAGVARLPNREKLLAAWKSLGSGPDRPAEIFIQQRGPRAVATMTASRVYASTYLLHTFAIEKRDAFHLPVEMFHRMRDFVLRERNAEFACGMWPAGHRFMERYYAAFVRRDFDPADHHFETTHVYRFAPPTPGPSPARENRFRTALASRDDRITVWETLKRSLSPVLFEAADWARKDLDLAETAGAFAKSDHLRRREIVTAKDGDSLLAFAVAEISSGGAGVFGLSNSFRIYFTRGGETRTAEHRAMIEALTAAVLARYRDHGIETCSLYGDKAWSWISGVPGYQAALGDTCLWIVRRSRVKAFLRHLERMNWELSFFRGAGPRIRPSVLRAFDYETAPFKPRKCMRLEDSEGIPGVTYRLNEGLEGRLANLDTYGASLILETPLDAAPGSELEMTLRLEHAPPIPLRAVVRYRERRVAPGFQTETVALGVEFLGAPIGYLEGMRDFVFRRLNPDIRLFAPLDFEPLAELLDRSDYFNYWEATNHRELIEDARPTYTSVLPFASTVSRTTVLPADGKIIGSHSFYRLNTRSWQLHQLAIDPNMGLYRTKLPTKVVLQSTFQYLCLDPTAEYFVTYFDDRAAIARAYFEAGHAHFDARDYAFIPFQLFIIHDSRSASPPVDTGRYGGATDSERQAIAEHLLSICPSIEYEALEFCDPGLRRFMAGVSESAIPRKQEVFVGRDKRGELRVFALVNLGPKSINFIGLTDTFRIFEVPWCNIDTREAKLDLARYVIQHFASLGRRHVYLEAEERDAADYSRVGARPYGRNWRLIAQKRCFMTALQFFLSRYGKLEERLAAQEDRAARPE
jgi:hypothetical protein